MIDGAFLREVVGQVTPVGGEAHLLRPSPGQCLQHLRRAIVRRQQRDLGRFVFSEQQRQNGVSVCGPLLRIDVGHLLAAVENARPGAVGTDEA